VTRSTLIGWLVLVAAVAVTAGVGCHRASSAGRWVVDSHDRILPENLGSRVVTIRTAEGPRFHCRSSDMYGVDALMRLLGTFTSDELSDGILVVCHSKRSEDDGDVVSALRAFCTARDADLFTKVPVSEGIPGPGPQPGDWSHWLVHSTHTKYRYAK
jgi:hypothetical protein